MNLPAHLPYYSKFIPFSLSLLMLFCACGSPSPKQQVEQVLDTREKSLASKDLAAYMAIISLHYSDKGKTYQDIKKAAEQNFAAFTKIELTSSKRAIYIEDSQAGVVQEYVLAYWLPSKDGKNSTRQSIKDKERLVLNKETDGWKIIKGL